MAKATIGTFIVSATVAAGTQTQADVFGTLAMDVARLVGGGHDAYEEAKRGIIDGVRKINMRHLFTFMRKQSAAITLVDGTDAYATQSMFYAMHAVQLRRTSDNQPYRTLRYMPWRTFQELVQLQTAEGIPEVWTFFNIHDDEEIILYPTPDATTASDYELVESYFERIATPNDDHAVIGGPENLSKALKSYAEHHVLFHFERENLAWQKKLREFEDDVRDFKFSWERQPDDSDGVSIDFKDQGRPRTTEVYVRLK